MLARYAPSLVELFLPLLSSLLTSKSAQNLFVLLRKTVVDDRMMNLGIVLILIINIFTKIVSPVSSGIYIYSQSNVDFRYRYPSSICNSQTTCGCSSDSS